MQRVVSINLNGNAYQLEENAYNALFAYLDATEAALKDSPDRAQKLADLEGLVAEKCRALLGPHKTVITSAEIDRILLELGPAPAQPAAEPAASSSSRSSTSSGTTSPNQGSPNSFSHRRLFQIREGAMLSGVCVGLSEFLHIDVTVIRILFVIFALATSGFGILAYGVLMFAVPRVDSRRQASGDTTPHRWPWDEHGWPWDRHGWPWDQPKNAAPPPAPPPLAAAPPPPVPLHTWPHGPGPVAGTFIMIVFLMFGFFWLSFWTRGHFFFGFPFFWGFPHWIGIIFFFMMLRLIFMPFRMARWYGYGPYGPYPHPHYAWVSMWNGMMWFGGLIFIAWIAYHYIPEVHDFIRSFETSWYDGSFHV